MRLLLELRVELASYATRRARSSPRVLGRRPRWADHMPRFEMPGREHAETAKRFAHPNPEERPELSAATHLSDLTIAIVHYQTPVVLDECLQRVRAAAPDSRVMVLDAGDERPLPSGWVGAGAELVRVANHSYAYAVNEAIKRCETLFLAVMNADVYVREETFANLLWAMRDPGVAAAGPLVQGDRGRLQDQGWPYRIHQEKVATGRPWAEVPWLSGCLQVVRIGAVTGTASKLGSGAATGGMDATLRFYNEDMEWGWRLRNAGWACRLVATPVVHLGGNATPPQRDAFLVEGLRGGYVISQRYLPPWRRVVHRRAVMLWAALQKRFGDPQKRRAYRAIHRMFARKRFSESPFGATLAEENPAFWNEMT